MSFREIRFDMSHEGLEELEKALFDVRDSRGLTPELQNFHNEIQNMLEPGNRWWPETKEEPSWLDA